METKIIKGGLTLQGTINAISSKSDLHRLLICGCLSPNSIRIRYHAELSKDINATISCLESLGAVIKSGNGIIEIIKPIDKDNIPANPVLDCNESGSTARFMLPIAAILAKGATLTGKGKLPERPFEQLCESLEKMGAKFSSHKLPITVEEIATPKGFYEISGNVSSQYITGLLFTLPICKASGIKLSTELESGGYVNLTADAMKRFGVDVNFENNIYTVSGTYEAPEYTINAQGDWSNAAFWLCSAKESPVTVTGLDLSSSQPDRKVCEILSEMGMTVNYGTESVTVSAPEGTHGISFDARNIPDLVPVLAVRASVSHGETIISGIRRLRIKESDRVKSVCDLINALGGCANSDEDHMYINGVKKLDGGTANSVNDHRIAMSAAIAATFCEKDVEITDPYSASKSYPDFYEDLEAMTKEKQ